SGCRGLSPSGTSDSPTPLMRFASPSKSCPRNLWPVLHSRSARIGSMPRVSGASMSAPDTHWFGASPRPEPRGGPTPAESMPPRNARNLSRGGGHDGSTHQPRSPSRHGSAKGNRPPPPGGGGGGKREIPAGSA